KVPALVQSNAFPRTITGSGTSFYIHYGLQTSAQNGLLVSTDSGTSWNTRSSGMPLLRKIRIVNNIFHGVGEYTFGLHQESGYYYSPDQGISWIGPQPIAPENSTPSITPDISVDSDGTIYTTWNDTGTIMMRRSIGHDADGNLLLGNIITISDEPGAVFSTIVSSEPFVSVVWDNNNGNNTIRLRSSNNDAESFCPADSPSTSNQASEPSIDLNGSQLHVVWSENFDGNTEIVYRKAMLQPDLRPKSFLLKQNYPNPANRITYISYDLPLPAIVSLRVYNILGQLISTLVDGVQPAATYTIPFSTERLASGVYFYQIRAFPFNETKKFVVLR
ncbi:MAG TPA: T9SS type A sorting domain-containing protein, partial [Bacteroidota bacterium]|nr:T9SS type A sorting domain-containing protein [Bacteroidota bacterium]